MLSSLHLVVDIRLDTSVVLVIITLILVFLLVYFLATQPFKEIADFCVVERIVQVLRQPLETTEQGAKR